MCIQGVFGLLLFQQVLQIWASNIKVIHHKNMKHILSIVAIFGFAVSAFAGCGITTTSTGKLKSYDQEAKTIVIVAEGKEIKTAVKATTKGAGEIASLIGKDVTAVISKHGYAESVAAKG